MDIEASSGAVVHSCVVEHLWVAEAMVAVSPEAVNPRPELAGMLALVQVEALDRIDVSHLQ